MVTFSVKQNVPEKHYSPACLTGTLRLMAKTGHFIREWRKFRGLTQDQLAEAVGITRPYLSKIESGKRRYDQNFLEAAAKVLKCVPADLIARDPNDPSRIWAIWGEIDAKDREQAASILETFARKKTGTDI